MHHHTITSNSQFSPNHGLFPPPSQNPTSYILRVLPQIRRPSSFNFPLRSHRTGIYLPEQTPNSRSSSNGSYVHDCTSKRTTEIKKTFDVATLGNLCVDIVLSVPKLPPSSRASRKAYMDELSASPPDKQYWEAGGNCNMAIAAARLGLHCVAIGHVGNEIYGNFLQEVLHDEGIGMVALSEETVIDDSDASHETLLCWVLVDPLQRHGFCSDMYTLVFFIGRADFKEEPAFSWMSNLSDGGKMAIKQSRILFCNGYGFDELSPRVIISAIEYAAEVGTSIFFDPGPRGKSLSTGTSEEQRALGQLLKMSDVLLLTSDEAESLTGIKNPVQAGQELLRKGVRTKWVIVKMGPLGSILITKSSVSCAPAFKVNVMDTVGCGDSFVAAIAFGFIHNMPLTNTLAIANAVGAATATGCGAGRNVATREQVIKLIRSSNLNEEDGEFWKKIIVNENLDASEITVLSKMERNGISNHLNHISLQKVVSELLPKLESAQLEEKLSP